MTYPKKIDGTSLNISVTKEGVTVYGNKQAFQSLQNWMKWIAESDEMEHYECHVIWSLDDETSDDVSKSNNISVMFDESTRKVFNQPSEDETGFELTFMAVENSDLKNLSNKK